MARDYYRMAIVMGFLLQALAVQGAPPSWYNCSCPASSGGATAGATPCICPSNSPPGGLAPSDTPQFVLFTHDDAFTSSTSKAFHGILDGKQSFNGCKAVATLFTTFTHTDCTLLKSFYLAGYEVADHTVSHPQMNGMPRHQVEHEVLGAQEKLATTCGIPAADIVGFRQPYLHSSPTVREVLAKGGFLYDSTLLEEAQASLSRGMGARVWPYTMQDGIPQNCAWYSPAQTCTSSEAYPGMWEVPLWSLTALGQFSMDYGNSEHSAYDVLKANFDAAYAGNRAPMPVYTHTPHMQRSLKDLKKFADYALSKPHVYFVTMRQLLAWMQNPISASRLTPAALGCGSRGGAGPAADNGPRAGNTTSLPPSPTLLPSSSPSPSHPSPSPSPVSSPPPANPSSPPPTDSAAPPPPAAPTVVLAPPRPPQPGTHMASMEQSPPTTAQPSTPPPAGAAPTTPVADRAQQLAPAPAPEALLALQNSGTTTADAAWRVVAAAVAVGLALASPL